ncbi:MAG: hypothetical protein LBC52_06715 [Treponema sp.]|nr:hypothetical protein [Treponema sp.]
MKRRNYMSVLWFFLAGIFLFISCKKGGTEKDNDPDYPINISIFSTAAMRQPPPDNKTYKWIKEEFNVTFTWDILVGQRDQKIGVMIAGEDYPDLLLADRKFLEAKALIPLEGLIEQYGPRLKQHYAEVWEKLKDDDDHIYYMPIWGVTQGKDHSIWYSSAAFFVQKEVLKEFGYPSIKTLDEYVDLLYKYKQIYPTINGQPTIAFTTLAHDWHSYCMINPPFFLAGFPNDGNGTIDPVTHEYKVFLYHDISKRWFKMFNKMNSLGMVDRSCFIENYDQYLAKIASGRVLGFHDQAWHIKQAEDSLTTQGMVNRTYAPLPIVFDENIRPHYRTRPTPSTGQGLSISIKAKDPVRIIRFLDAQLDEKAQRVFSWGFEGEDYHYDENGQPYRTPEQRKQQEDDVWKLHNRAELWTGHNPKIQGSFSDGYPTSLGDIYSEREATLKPEDKELWAAYGVTNYPELMDKDPPPNSIWFPAWEIQIAGSSDAKIAWQRAESVYRKYLPRIVLAPTDQFEGLWTDYTAELKKTGLEKYEAYMQQEINKRIEKWSPKE